MKYIKNWVVAMVVGLGMSVQGLSADEPVLGCESISAGLSCMPVGPRALPRLIV